MQHKDNKNNLTGIEINSKDNKPNLKRKKERNNKESWKKWREMPETDDLVLTTSVIEIGKKRLQLLRLTSFSMLETELVLQQFQLFAMLLCHIFVVYLILHRTKTRTVIHHIMDTMISEVTIK